MTVALKATFYAPAAPNLVVRAGVEKKIIGKTSVQSQPSPDRRRA
jgi:hypothetical protein